MSERLQKILKKALKIVALLLLIAGIVLAYYYFWPRYLYKVYGYREVKLENDHSEWHILTEASFQGSNVHEDVSKWWNRVYPHIGKVNIYKSPYQIRVWHNPRVEVKRINIMDSKNILKTLENGNRNVLDNGNEEVDVVTIYRDIELEYRDYELVVHYSLKAQEVKKDRTINVQLEKDFLKEKVSLFEIALGI